MRSPVVKFFVAVLFLAAICSLLEMVWKTQMPGSLQMNNAYALLGIFVVTSTVLHLFMLRSAKGTPQGFIRAFMLATVLRFFLYLGVILGYMLFSSENKKSLALHFLLYYALFTIVEVGILYAELLSKKQDKK